MRIVCLNVFLVVFVYSRLFENKVARYLLVNLDDPSNSGWYNYCVLKGKLKWKTISSDI